MPPDYSGQNLRGRSFKGQNLEGANFSGADIRSADFSGAKLRGANFSQVKAGWQKRWAFSLIVVSYLLFVLSGLGSALAGYSIALIFNSNNLVNQIAGLTASIIRCEYVYMRLPTKDNLDPLRKPDNNSS